MPINVINKPNYGSPLQDALKAGISVFDAISTNQRNDQLNQVSMASASKTRAEEQLLQDELKYRQNLGGNISTILQGAPQPQVEIPMPAPSGIPIDPNYQAPSYTAPDMRGQAYGEIGRVDPAMIKSVSELASQQMRNDQLRSGTNAINAMPDSLTKTAYQTDVGNNKSFPDVVGEADGMLYNKYDINAPTINNSIGTGGEIFTAGDKRKHEATRGTLSDFNKMAEGHRSLTANVETIRDLYKRGTGLAHEGMISKLMKMYDDRSQVTQSESDMARGAGGAWTRLQSYLNVFTKGGKLAQPQVDDIMNISEDLYKTSQLRYKEREKITEDELAYWKLPDVGMQRVTSVSEAVQENIGSDVDASGRNLVPDEESVLLLPPGTPWKIKGTTRTGVTK